MSRYQSRGRRNESTQYRRTGRSGNSNQQSQFPAGVSTKGGGGASSAPSNPASRSFEKYNSNAQRGQSRAGNPNVDSNLGAHAPHGPTHNAPTQNSSQSTTRPSSTVSSAASASNVPAANFESEISTSPAKGDASKSFPLQFGSITPGFMNGVQIPARTSSAPPNLDEQKKPQARRDSLRAAPAIPIPSIPKKPLVKKDAGNLDHAKAGQAQLVSKSKRDAQVSAALSVAQNLKPTEHPIHGMPMQLPFHQPQVPVQFGGPSPEIQSQAMSGTSLPLQMQMPLPIRSLPMQQPMFISGLQPHPIHSQGMMHQGQNLNFSTQMGHQLPPQLGGMGIHMAPQFPQQQTGKYSGSHKTVKITHPETHEELRLDGSPGLISHPNVPLQPLAQPNPSFAPARPMNIYPYSYSAVPICFPGGSPLNKNSTQVPPPPTSQPPRSYNQVTAKPPVDSHKEKEQLPSSISVGEAESSEPLRLHEEDSVHPQREVEPSSLSSFPQSKPGLGTSSTPAASSGSVTVESDVTDTSASASTTLGGFASALTSSADDERKGEIVSDSSNDKPNKLSNREQQDKIGKPSTLLSSLTSQFSETEPVKTKSNLPRTNLVCATAKESSPTTVALSETDNLTSESAPDGKTCNACGSLGMNNANSRQLEPEIIESSDQVTSSIGGSFKQTKEEQERCLGLCSNDIKMTDSLVTSTHTKAEGSESVNCLSAQDDTTSSSDTLLSLADGIGTRKTGVVKSALVVQESASDLVLSAPDSALKTEDDATDSNCGGSFFPSPSSVEDKVLLDASLEKTAAPRGKKKRRELYRKAEAAGASSDLYMAYKGPEEKKETVTSAKDTEKASNIDIKRISAEILQENRVSGVKPAVSEVEPDDWEDVAEISPQLETSKNENQGSNGDGVGLTTERYSRDFLLKFVGQCTDLPEGFEITSDIADALVVSSVNVLHESYPSPGRNIDRPLRGSRPDRRSGSLGDDDKWSKLRGSLMPGRGDMRADVGYAGNAAGFRPGQGGNYGVLRNPRAQTPAHYAGGILPMQSLGPQGYLQRNNSDSDRWQRGTGFPKGLMSSPQTPQPMMHKAEKKYEIGKVADGEEAKQRQLKAILNKLTPQNFEKLFQQVKEVNIDNACTLSGVISQIFDKALMEPTFCEMYANFCFHLASDLPDFSVENEKITFKRLLLNKCQEEFESGDREEDEANKAEEECEVKQTSEEREEKRLRARRRMLGNIRLIGELYKKSMLTERIMHDCIEKLLGQHQNPDEENIEALCKLMSTIGEMIDSRRAKRYMDAYFDIMAQLSNNMKLSSRVRFMLKDAIDLRKNKWQQRRKVEGPKKIEEVHRDAVQERQAQGNRSARAPSMGSSIRKGLPMDSASRAPSILSSPGSYTGSFRTASPQLHGYSSQGVRMDERHSFENRAMSRPLSEGPFGHDSITLGPQGGLMAFQGQSSTPSNYLSEMSSPADARRMGPGLNGFSSMPEQTAFGQREDIMPRYMPNRFDTSSINDQVHPQEQSVTYGNREIRSTDHDFGRSLPTSRVEPPNSTQNVSSGKVWPEEHLQDKSMAAIKEFYSARDENEVALCIKELNAPTYYPSMISLWLVDSFERKDKERDLLTNLLIKLAKPQDGMISREQLIKGFESVATVLEDAVNDAPRAAEFLGRIFARVILANVVSLSEIGRLIYEGGEERGSLVEIGLAAEVMGTILDMVRSDKGDSVLSEVLSGFDLRLENFKPPGCNKSWGID